MPNSSGFFFNQSEACSLEAKKLMYGQASVSQVQLDLLLAPSHTTVEFGWTRLTEPPDIRIDTDWLQWKQLDSISMG